LAQHGQERSRPGAASGASVVTIWFIAPGAPMWMITSLVSTTCAPG
jgi:hypothetical protein